MSEYLLRTYRPVADALLSTHGLSVPVGTRDMLANTIMVARRLPRNSKGESYSPAPTLKKALTHARALLQYVEKPPTRKDSIGKRCTRLRAALVGAGGDLLAVELALATKSDHFYPTLRDSLEVGRADAPTLSTLVEALERIQPQSGNWRLGRPREFAKRIVRAGCLAWKRAGRPEHCSWNGASDKLTGPLPDFLRALIACCNGTNEQVQANDRGRQSEPSKTKGDGWRLSDKALYLALIDCKNSGLLSLSRAGLCA